MPPFLEGTGLQEAICTTLVQLCKVGVAYQSDLSIKGTIGVTVDKRQVILVHVDEHFETGLPLVDSNQSQAEQQRLNLSNSDLNTNALMNSSISTQDLNAASFAAGSMSMISSPHIVSVAATSGTANPVMIRKSQPLIPPVPDNTSTVPQLGSGMAVPISFWQHAMRSVYSQIKIPQNPSLGDPSNLPFTATSSSQVDDPTNASPMDTKHKILTLSESVAIDLDSDSESLLHFDDDDVGGGDKSALRWMEKKEPHVSDMDPDIASTMRRSDEKNIIVIDDATDLIQDDVMDHSETDAASVTEDDERHKWNLHRSLNSSTDSWPSAMQMKVEALEGAQILASVSGQGDDTESVQGEQNSRLSSDWPWENKRDKSQTNTSNECEICHKTFSFVSSAHLECHLVETHNITISKQLGPIPHKCCPHCDKKFRFQTTLEKHLFVHIDQKPYKCSKCPNAYCYEESLEIHRVSHNGNFTCSICNRTYANRKLFQKHIIYMHEMRRSTRKKKKNAP